MHFNILNNPIKHSFHLVHLSDEQIVQTVRLHFDADIERELRLSVVGDVNEMISLLDTLENERETRKLCAEVYANSVKPVMCYENIGDKANRRKEISLRRDDSITNSSKHNIAGITR